MLAATLALILGIGLGWLSADLLADSSAGPAGVPRMPAAENQPDGFGEPMAGAWSAPDTTPELSDDTVHTWAGKDTLFRIDPAGIAALDPEDGTMRWEAELPDSAALPCPTAGPVDANGVLLQLYRAEDSAACSALVAVDAANGELLWDEQVASAGTDSADSEEESNGEPGEPGDSEGSEDFAGASSGGLVGAAVPAAAQAHTGTMNEPRPDVGPGTGSRLLATSETVVVLPAAGGSSAERFAISDGARLDPLMPPADSDCWGSQVFMAGEQHVLLWAACDSADDAPGDGARSGEDNQAAPDEPDRRRDPTLEDGPWQVTALNLNDGVAEWTYRVTANPHTVQELISEDPLILREGSQVRAFDEAGTRRWTIQEEGVLTGSAVSDTTVPRLVLQLQRDGENYLLGHDLSDGSRLWEQQAPPQRLVGIEGDHLLALDAPDHPGRESLIGDQRPEGQLRLWWVGVEDGTALVSGLLPEDIGDAQLFAGDRSLAIHPAWDSSRLYVTVTGESETGALVRTVAYERHVGE